MNLLNTTIMSTTIKIKSLNTKKVKKKSHKFDDALLKLGFSEKENTLKDKKVKKTETKPV